MIEVMMAMARTYYENTNRKFTHIYAGPRAYAAIEQAVRRSAIVPCEGENPVMSIGGYIVVPCEAEGLLFR